MKILRHEAFCKLVSEFFLESAKMITVHCIKKAHLCPKKIAGSDLAVINDKRCNSIQISKTTTNLVNIQNLPRVKTKVSKSN